MNNLQKYLSTCLLATAALVVGASPAWAQVSLGTASNFAVLAGTNVTCTAPGSVVAGDVGVSPGTIPPFTNTGCTFAGGTPPATNAAAVGARKDFLSAYAALAPTAGECDVNHTLLSTIPASTTLFPGTYCTGAALTATNVVLTLDGQNNSNAVWIFKIGAGFTGTVFSVVMANGGQPCNVFWRVGGGVTMTTSALKGNILAGDATGGSITLTGGTLAGRALANVAVTMTGTSASVILGCGALASSSPGTGKGKGCDGDDNDKDKEHRSGNPFGSDDDHGRKSGDK